MANPVVHFEILGQDAAALREYYSGLFGWEFSAPGPIGYHLTDPGRNAGGAGIAGAVGAMPAGYPGQVTFYVEVPDVEAALAKAERLGGQRLMGPEKVMDGVEIGQFADPEGHVIGLVRAAG
jgi:predicted enzyme related to lactoylglutathione lyase